MRKPFNYGLSELHQGDCLAWLKRRAEQSIHGVVTDPPYGLHEYTREQLQKMRSGSGGVWRIAPSFDGHQRAPLPRFTVLKPADLEYLHDFFYAWASVLHPALLPGAHVVVACNPLISPYISMALAKAGLERRGELVRLVQTMRGGDRPKNAHDEFSDVSVMPRSQWEPWLVYRRPIDTKTVADNLRKHKVGAFRRVSGAQPFGDVIRSLPTSVKEREIAPHPSLKPQAFLRSVVRAVLPLGEGVVLDPYAGSGSTLAAAEAVGYQSVGVELYEDYFDLAKSSIPKLAALSGREAEHEVSPLETSVSAVPLWGDEDAY